MTPRWKRCLRPIFLIAAEFLSFLLICRSAFWGIRSFFEMPWFSTSTVLAVLSIPSSLLSILTVINAVFMIVWGILYLLKSLDVANVSVNMEKAPHTCKKGLSNNMALYISMAVLNKLSMITASLYYDFLFYLNINWFLAPFLAIASYVAYIIMEKNGLFSDDTSSQIYECSNCRARAKAGSTFCTICGSPVVAVEKASTPSVSSAPTACPACGARMNPNDKFCTVCGTNPASYRCVCLSCGSKLAPRAQFCTVCGASVVSPTDSENTTSEFTYHSNRL